MPTRPAPDRLTTTTDDTSLLVRLAPRAAVRFERRRDRAAVRLRFGTAGVGPDVSFQPATVDRVVRDQARLAGVDPNRWCGEVVGSLIDWAPELAWVERRPDRLVAAVGGFTHALLGHLYREGRQPLGEVPRWASPILAAPDVGEAARRLCHGSGNRRLTRVLAGSLVARADVIDLDRLALAVAGAGLVTDDELANLLEVPVGDAPVPAPVSVEDVRAIRVGLGWYPSGRRARLLVDAARHAGAADVARLLGRLRWVIDTAPRPLPVTASALEELCGRLVPVVAARPAQPPAPTPNGPGVPAGPEEGREAVAARGPQRRSPRQDAPRPDGTVDAAPAGPVRRDDRPGRPGQVPRHPPAAPATVPPTWPVHPELVAVSERRAGDLTLCVPTSVAELRAWSRRLRNCLDTFGPAVAHGRSWVIGIRRGDELVGAVEICSATRRLRQAQGPRNRALPDPVYDQVIAVLGDAGILRVHRRAAT